MSIYYLCIIYYLSTLFQLKNKNGLYISRKLALFYLTAFTEVLYYEMGFRGTF